MRTHILGLEYPVWQQSRFSPDYAGDLSIARLRCVEGAVEDHKSYQRLQDLT